MSAPNLDVPLDPERALAAAVECEDCQGFGFVRVCRCDPYRGKHDADCPRVEVCFGCLGTGRRKR